MVAKIWAERKNGIRGKSKIPLGVRSRFAAFYKAVGGHDLPVFRVPNQQLFVAVGFQIVGIQIAGFAGPSSFGSKTELAKSADFL